MVLALAVPVGPIPPRPPRSARRWSRAGEGPPTPPYGTQTVFTCVARRSQSRPFALGAVMPVRSPCRHWSRPASGCRPRPSPPSPRHSAGPTYQRASTPRWSASTRARASRPPVTMLTTPAGMSDVSSTWFLEGRSPPADAPGWARPDHGAVRHRQPPAPPSRTKPRGAAPGGRATGRGRSRLSASFIATATPRTGTGLTAPSCLSAQAAQREHGAGIRRPPPRPPPPSSRRPVRAAQSARRTSSRTPAPPGSRRRSRGSAPGRGRSFFDHAAGFARRLDRVADCPCGLPSRRLSPDQPAVGVEHRSGCSRRRAAPVCRPMLELRRPVDARQGRRPAGAKSGSPGPECFGSAQALALASQAGLRYSNRPSRPALAAEAPIPCTLVRTRPPRRRGWVRVDPDHDRTAAAAPRRAPGWTDSVQTLAARPLGRVVRQAQRALVRGAEGHPPPGPGRRISTCRPGSRPARHSLHRCRRV